MELCVGKGEHVGTSVIWVAGKLFYSGNSGFRVAISRRGTIVIVFELY